MSLLCEVLKKINIDINNDSAKVISLKFYAKKDTLELILEDNVPLAFESYQKLFDGLKNSCHTNVDIIVRSLSNDNDIQKFHKYLNYFDTYHIVFYHIHKFLKLSYLNKLLFANQYTLSK